MRWPHLGMIALGLSAGSVSRSQLDATAGRGRHRADALADTVGTNTTHWGAGDGDVRPLHDESRGQLQLSPFATAILTADTLPPRAPRATDSYTLAARSRRRSKAASALPRPPSHVLAAASSRSSLSSPSASGS